VTPPPGKPVVLVDGRLARRRRTGIARVINETRTALLMDPPTDIEVVFTEGPPALPRRNKFTSVGNLIIDMLWLTVGLPAMAKRKKASLIHAPMNWGALRGHTPMTVMIQDLAFERMPDQYPGGFRRWASFVGKRTAKRARLVMTTTESGARDVEQIYRVPRSRIRVVNLGTDPDHQPEREREPFILAVGEFEPRKRVLELMKAHEKYFASAPGYPPLCRLVKHQGRPGRMRSVSACITARLAPTNGARSILLITSRSERVMPGPPLRGILSPAATSIT
jgi:glycosyltransferase involved in cell wall biosynthesis